MNEYLLSDEAITALVKSYGITDVEALVSFLKEFNIAAVKHTLEQLEKERRIIHMPTDYMLYPLDKPHNTDNCWLCAALREVGA